MAQLAEDTTDMGHWKLAAGLVWGVIMLELGFGLSAMKCSVEEVTQVTTDLSALVSYLRAGRRIS